MNSHPSEPKPHAAFPDWYPARQHAPPDPQKPVHVPAPPQSTQQGWSALSSTATGMGGGGGDGSGVLVVDGGVDGSPGGGVSGALTYVAVQQ